MIAAAVAAPAAATADAAPWFPPLDRPPLDPPLVVTAGFGEFRSGHFHAGLDLGTGGLVGRPVYAPLSGWIERVRASGVGYGRAIYLHGDDGRLLVFGHLDAFDEPLASYVASVQDTSGLYEQDLWPAPGALRVAAGRRIAWSGESGAGGPHLHFEIRRGDMAFNPLRAGLPIDDPTPPRLIRLTLEPLDGESRVAGSAAPRSVPLRAQPETLAVVGRVRAVIRSADAIGPGAARAVPWWVSLEDGVTTVECRFDSVSWATDMTESDYVYDTGRITGDRGTVLWAPAGFRPRVLVGSGDRALALGVIEVAPGDPPRRLRVTAGDVAGHRTTREVVLRADDAPPPLVAAATASSVATVAAPVFELASLPGGRLAVRLERSKSCRFDQAAVGGARGAVSGGGAVLRVGALPAFGPLLLEGGSPSHPCVARSRPLRLSAVVEGAADSLGALRWSVPAGTLFEPAIFAAESLGRVAGAGELAAVGEAYALGPASLPLRRPIGLRLALPPGGLGRGGGLYQNSGQGWELLSFEVDSAAGFVSGATRRLGRIGLFRDLTPPRIRRVGAPRRAPPGPYSRWALEARLVERGSGIDARATCFIVDGRRVPSEWDAEKRTLRWRPLRPPSRGRHRYLVVAIDRAGNAARASGGFVLD